MPQGRPSSWVFVALACVRACCALPKHTSQRGEGEGGTTLPAIWWQFRACSFFLWHYRGGFSVPLFWLIVRIAALSETFIEDYYECGRQRKRRERVCNVWGSPLDKSGWMLSSPDTGNTSGQRVIIFHVSENALKVIISLLLSDWPSPLTKKSRKKRSSMIKGDGSWFTAFYYLLRWIERGD